MSQVLGLAPVYWFKHQLSALLATDCSKALPERLSRFVFVSSFLRNLIVLQYMLFRIYFIISTMMYVFYFIDVGPLFFLLIHTYTSLCFWYIPRRRYREHRPLKLFYDCSHRIFEADNLMQ